MGRARPHPEPEQVRSDHAFISQGMALGAGKGSWVLVVFLFPCSAQQLGSGWDFSIILHPSRLSLVSPVWLREGMSPPRGVPVVSWETSRNWRDRLDVLLMGACSLSQSVCVSIGLGQPQREVHVCMVRGKLEHFPPSPALCSGCLQRRQKIPCAQRCGPGMPPAPAEGP